MINSNRIIGNWISVKDTLEIIDKQKIYSFCVVDQGQRIIGVVTDGDIRRWLFKTECNIACTSIGDVANKNFIKLDQGKRLSKKERKDLLNRGIEFLPVLSKEQHLIKIHEVSNDSFIQIGDRLLGENHPVFIIAEIGNNHQGSLETAKKMIDLAADAGVDAVKFQLRNMDEVYGKRTRQDTFDLGVEYTLDLLEKYQLSNKDIFIALDYAKSKNLIAFCTPWDVNSAKALSEYDTPVFKVASADMTNFELIDYLCSQGKPLLISTGMSEEAEILRLTQRLNYLDVEYCLLHCNSTYPAPYEQINLKYIERLATFGGKCVGYSGHERGYHVALAAVALGATVIEKHFTLDRNQEGVDHRVSLLPEELSQMVNHIRELEVSLKGPTQRSLSQGEMLNQHTLGKSIYSARSIKEGERLQREDMVIRSPGGGLKPYEIDKLIGKKISSNVEEGTALSHSHFESREYNQLNFSFKRKFGIPVRYHDYHVLMKRINCPLVEFHFSAKDLGINPNNVFENQKYEQEVVVHCPELFDGDNLLDLASDNPAVKDRSIEDVIRTINVCNNIKSYFQNKSVKLIINAGGWTQGGFINSKEKTKKYLAVKESITKLLPYLDNIIICIQTMPPFPWHFGGQSYHNLFVDALETRDFLVDMDSENVKVCFDVSHTLLSSNYYGYDFYDQIRVLAPFIEHLHISDAEGNNGEGAAFGKGLLNINKLADTLDQENVNCSFIPEVWQGHKNNGDGFISALKMLDRKL